MLQSPKQIAEVLSRQYPKLTWYISHEIQHHSAKYSTSTDRFKFDFQKSAKKQSKRKFFYLVNFYINFTSFVAYSRFLLEMMFITTLQLRYIFLNETFPFMPIGSMTVNGDFFSTFLVWSKLINSNSLKNLSKL